MQVKSYTDLKALIQALAGVSSFTSEENTKILSFVNRRAAEAYNLSPSWARYLVESEERNIAVFKVSGYSNNDYNGLFYKIGDKSDGSAVYGKMGKTSSGNRADSTLYQYNNSSKNWFFSAVGWTKNLETGVVTIGAGVTLNTQRDSSIEYDNPWDVIWTNPTGSAPKVEKVQTIPYDDIVEAYSNADPAIDKTTIGEFVRVHRKKAFLNESAIEYDFFVDNDGANILNAASSEDGSLFVTYKKPFTEFTTSSTDIPQEFFYFVAHAAYADFLRMDGQHGKALTEEQLAQNFLDIELEKIDIRSNNNSINKKFSTYVNRQSR